ncbi:hypothetical protein NV379_00445 [Paenibacillus sp. N1-5-1-14]|uniref:hypothetical protein n=1 Tax=Paenibacillus radicibacter TaxID=2972488 RepID=UPI002158F99B|nr:hypothetical protein [Paenibacillus radicibacter]MCR8641111.1 hypothetical protein [Paenibacillus radicibacter]
MDMVVGIIVVLLILGFIWKFIILAIENIWITLIVITGIFSAYAMYRSTFPSEARKKNVAHKQIKKGNLKFDENYEQNEQDILELVDFKKGRVTPFEVAIRTGLSLQDSKRYLDYFMSMGIARKLKAINTSDVYHFTEVLTDEEKRRAESV